MRLWKSGRLIDGVCEVQGSILGMFLIEIVSRVIVA